jgi:threonylcarbamoyladenosine tRNA methylthiotransferase MtaB
LQSGSKTVLQRMKRRYTPEEYRKATQLLRTYFPNCSLTTDVMVGFPGETEEEFEESYRFIKDIAFSTLHVFKYSKREGTPAATYVDQVPAKVKDDRSKRLIALSEELAYSYQKRFLNQKMPVLMESILEDQPDVYQGHTTNYLLVLGRSDRNLVNQIVTMQLEFIENDHVVGSILKES